MKNLPAALNHSTLNRYLRTGGGLTAAEWMAQPELKSLPVLASNEPFLLPTDIEPGEWKSIHSRAFGQYLRTGRLVSMGEGLGQVERKFNPYHDPQNGQFTSGPGLSSSGETQNSVSDPKEIVVTASKENIRKSKIDGNKNYQRSSITSINQANELVSNQDGSYVGKNAQCASLTKALAPEVGAASTWQRGEIVQGNANIPIGTPIATFNYYGNSGTNGYGPSSDPGGISRSSHTGIYLGQDENGLWILHQYSGSHGPHIENIPWGKWSHGTAEAGSRYYTIRKK